MKKLFALLMVAVFITGLVFTPAFAQEKKKTTGEVWKEKKYKQIDEEAKKKKEKAEDDAAGKYGGANTADKKKKQIDEESKKKKKEVDDTYEKLGPAKDRPYKDPNQKKSGGKR